MINLAKNQSPISHKRITQKQVKMINLVQKLTLITKGNKEND
jgi:hypothetical protein